jgi:hypothetical protein
MTTWISPGQFPYTGTSRHTPSRLSDYSLVKEQSKLSFANSDGNFRYDRRVISSPGHSRRGRRNNIVRFRGVNGCREFSFSILRRHQINSWQSWEGIYRTKPIDNFTFPNSPLTIRHGTTEVRLQDEVYQSCCNCNWRFDRRYIRRS